MNVGYATLQVIPSFKGAESAIQQGLAQSGGGAAAAGTAIGGKFAAAFTKAGPYAMAAGAGIAAGKFLYDLGSQFDEVFDHIRTGTGTTGKALEGLKGDWKSVVASVPTDFTSAGEAVTTLYQKLGLTGAPLQKLSGQFLELSRITETDLNTNLQAGTDVLASFGIAGKEQRVGLDQLFRASQQSGVGFSDLAANVASNGVTLRAAGFTFAESTALMASLGKAGIDVSQVMPGLSKALGVAASEGKSAQQFIGEFFEGIKNAPDDVAASQMAFDVLGAKAGPKFAQLIREGKLSYEDMLAKVLNGKDTIIGAGKDTQDFGEQWTMFKNQVLVAIEPIATKFFAALAEGMAWINAHKEEFQQFFTAVADAVKMAWTLVEPYYKALFDQLVNVFNLIDDIIHGRWGQLWGDFVAIFEGAWNLLKAPIDGVMALFHISFGDIKDFVLGVGNDIIGFYLSIPEKLAGVGAAIANAIGGAFKGAWNNVADFINDLIPNEINIAIPLAPDIHIDLPNNPLPKFHQGGIYRALFRGGEGLALLRDGEGVFTRDQMRALGDGDGKRGKGGMNFYGPVTIGDRNVLPDLDYYARVRLAGV